MRGQPGERSGPGLRWRRRSVSAGGERDRPGAAATPPARATLRFRGALPSRLLLRRWRWQRRCPALRRGSGRWAFFPPERDCAPRRGSRSARPPGVVTDNNASSVSGGCALAPGGAARPAAAGARGGSAAGAEPAERRSRWAEGQGPQPARPAAARGPLPSCGRGRSFRTDFRVVPHPAKRDQLSLLSRSFACFVPQLSMVVSFLAENVRC